MNQDNIYFLYLKFYGYLLVLFSFKSFFFQDGFKGRSLLLKDEWKEVFVSDVMDVLIVFEVIFLDMKDEFIQSVVKGNFCFLVDNVFFVSVEECVLIEIGFVMVEEVFEGKDLDLLSFGEVFIEKELFVDKFFLDVIKIEEVVSGELDKSGKVECIEVEEFSEIQVE